MSDESEIRRILERVSRRENGAADELLARLYDQLHSLAQWHMRGQRSEHTLQPTALVNEAYLRILGGREPLFQDQAHLMRAASRAMRCILVDHAREKARLKRCPGGGRLPLDGLMDAYEERSEDLIALDEALRRLADIDPRAVEVVELRFFGGRTQRETAQLLGISDKTVERDWSAARAWLSRELT